MPTHKFSTLNCAPSISHIISYSREKKNIKKVEIYVRYMAKTLTNLNHYTTSIEKWIFNDLTALLIGSDIRVC